MECYNKFYIHNFKLKPCTEFNESIFLTGTSIYEVIRIKQNIPLFLEDHLSRLFHSADISNLSIHESYCDIETLIAELIKKNDSPNGKIKIVIHFDSNSGHEETDFLIYFTPHYFPSNNKYKQGVKTGLCRAARSNPNAKILNTEARKIANNRIVEEKKFEVLLLNNNDFITEGSRSNVFFIKDNKIITPKGKDVLKGIARKNILDICKHKNIEVIEREIHYTEIIKMDAMFLSGTSLKVLPVKNFEDHEFSTENNYLKQIMLLYDKAIDDYLRKLT